LPARTLTGRVIYADTGRPAAHVEGHVGTGGGPGGVQQGGIRYLQAETDAEDLFRVSVMPGDKLNVWAAAPDGQASVGCIFWPHWGIVNDRYRPPV
jgi:hypothetical protein